MAVNFDVLDSGLDRNRLIEASAGTGKTYSIAILALRLVLEKNIPIGRILMVTFTNPAVAELESRVRMFIRKAYQFANGSDIDDAIIKSVVGDADAVKRNLLREALQSLDDLSVMTIHSFCQKTIDRFTFETGQSFDFEIIRDDSFLFREMVNAFRREVINTIDDYEWFKEINSELNFDKMPQVLKKCLEGKIFLDVDLSSSGEINEYICQSKASYQKLRDHVIKNFDRIKATGINKNTNLYKSQDSPEKFLPIFIRDCCLTDKYREIYMFLYEPFGREYVESCRQVRQCIYLTYIRSSRTAIEKIKKDKGYISYDDQIKTIYNALGNEGFRQKLAEEYQAVFIDEFQDTDKYQYEIFRSVFSGNSSLFLIGDPKQSIYGWRSADLDTYNEARKDAELSGGVFSMNRNFRSTARMISALNTLMNPGKGFNMFMDHEIRYADVTNGKDPGTMTENGKEVLPVTIWDFDPNDFETNCQAVTQEIYRLLTGDPRINGKKIRPRDIGVLVRDNKEGAAIKDSLAELRIPAVKRDSARVLQSEEACQIRYLLNAVINPERGEINRALNYKPFGFSTGDIMKLDGKTHLEIFIDLRKKLAEEGIYNMIAQFMSAYGIRAVCINDVKGQRILTNINQIAEILHRIEKKHKYTPEELLLWMERNKDDDDEEFEQRIESDEEAVQISTIHKAKGLEYNIVFAPFLSMIPKKKHLENGNINEFRKNGEYFFTLNYGSLAPEDKLAFDTQKEQENRRLVYVTLTRPVYKCYISNIPRLYNKKPVDSSLSVIIDQYTGNSPLIETIAVPKGSLNVQNAQYDPGNTHKPFDPRTVPQITISNTLGIHSFSSLSRTHSSAPFEKAELAAEYDSFIFQELGRGANAGTALHAIFERLDFSNPRSWPETIKAASQYWPNIIREDKLRMFLMLVENVINAPIKCGSETVKLCEVAPGEKLPELEFLFSVDRVNRQVLNEYLGEEARIGGDSEMEGLMTGFIDLVFLYKEKYYILDWKSNHLGNSVNDYGQDGIKKAMDDNNYTLQYHIYTVALKRWFESRGLDFHKAFGGVIYVFLRGVRQDGSTGIYTTKPGKELIDRLDNALRSDK